MERVAIQIKKRLDKIDCRKIYKNYRKINFLILNNNILYGINRVFKLEDSEQNKTYVIKNHEKYVVLEIKEKDINYDLKLIELLQKMIMVLKDEDNQINNINSELEYLIANKNQKFYELKYEENILLAKILSGQAEEEKTWKEIIKRRLNQNKIVNKEYEILEEKGFEKYVYLKACQLVNLKTYEMEIRKLINTLIDPIKVFDICKYFQSFGAAILLASSTLPINFRISNNYDYSIISFQALYDDYQSRIRKMMMYKMIHARKVKISGKLIAARFDQVLASSDLFYLPYEIIYQKNSDKKRKTGDFIVKISPDMQIKEAYECLSLDFVLK